MNGKKAQHYISVKQHGKVRHQMAFVHDAEGASRFVKLLRLANAQWISVEPGAHRAFTYVCWYD